MPLSESIAESVGYQNVEHFNRVFKKMYNITPGPVQEPSLNRDCLWEVRQNRCIAPQTHFRSENRAAVHKIANDAI